jgi:imidazolonepropionase-like amidohydrolase
MSAFKIIKGSLLVDGTGKAPLEDGAVLVENGRILEVGPAVQIKAPAGADVELLDFPGETILPGLVDAHTHLTINPEHQGLAGQIAGLLEPDGAQTIRGVRNLRLDLKSGVTTVRVVAEENFNDVQIKRAVEAGTVPGPRLLVSTRGLTATGGHGSPGWFHDGVDDIRLTIRENVANGADLTKILVTDTGPTTCTYSREEIRAAVEESARWGKPVAAHAMGRWETALKMCLEEGVYTIEHMVPRSEETRQLYIQTGAWLCRTFVIYFQTQLPSWELFHRKTIRERRDIMNRIMEETLAQRPLPDPALEERFAYIRDQEAENLLKAFKAGVNIAVGMDSMHGLLPLEIEWLVRHGFTEMEAIQVATLNGAKACRVDGETGSLEANKAADIITVKGNPLEDIKVLNDVDLVMARGVRMGDISIW